MKVQVSGDKGELRTVSVELMERGFYQTTVEDSPLKKSRSPSSPILMERE